MQKSVCVCVFVLPNAIVLVTCAHVFAVAQLDLLAQTGHYHAHSTNTHTKDNLSWPSSILMN